MNDFTIIRRSMTSRGFSTAVTIALVAVSVGLMVLLLSLRRAGQRAFERGAGDLHMLVSRDASPLVAVLNGIFHANPPRNPIPWAKYEEIANGFPLDYAVPVQQGDSFRGHPVVATEPSFFARYRPDPDLDWAFAEGRPFEGSFEVVVGADAARTTALRPGDTLHLTHGAGAGVAHHDHGGDHVHQEFPYTVVGVLAPTGGPHDRALFTDLESTWIIHAHDRRQREANDPHVTTRREDLTEADRLITGVYLRVLTRRGSQVSAAQQQVFDMLRKDTSITVASPAQEIGTLFRIVSNLDDLFLAMAAVVMVSSAIAIMLALYNSMEQRRRQIAVLRVLGCSRGRIFGLIVTESAILGIAGAVVGIAVAAAGGLAVASVMRARLGLIIEPRLGFETVAVVTLAAIGLAAGAGVVPAIMAYRTAVVRNLRPLG